MREFLQDVRYGGRVLLRQPGFTAVVAATLALAIGANTLIFSIASFLLLRPLPFKDTDAIVAVYAIDPQRGDDRQLTSHGDFLEWREQATSFQALGAYADDTFTMTGRGEPRRLQAERVTANLFDIWKLEMEAGRGFEAGEDEPGAVPVAVLSYGFWQREFASDPGVLGEVLTLDGVGYTVVGVLTEEMELGNLSLIDVWTPVTLDPGSPRDERVLRAFARLRPGVTVEQATAEMAAIARRQAADHPLTSDGWSAHTMPLLQAMTGRNTWMVLTLLGLVVVFVLVIACANVANLMLARAVARRKELAVRASLGAGRWRLVRQLVTESLLLGILGGVLGLALARGGLSLMQAVAYEPFFAQIGIDYRVMTFVAVLSLVTPLLFSFLPAIHAARLNLNQALLEGAGRTSGGVKGRRSRGALVVAQLSLAVVLLVMSTLVVRTAIAQAQLDLGFDPANVLTLQIELSEDRYADDDAVRRFYDSTIDRLAELPGVATASVTAALPTFGVLSPQPFAIDNRPPPPDPVNRPWALQATVSPQYFDTFDIPILRGRGFARADTPEAPGVVIISAETERRYWPNEDPIGRRIQLEDGGPWLEIVGVVADVFNQQELTNAFHPELYVPAAQHPRRGMAVAIRAASEPEALQDAVRTAIRTEDPTQAVYDVRTMAQVYRDQLASDRVIFGMFVSFALVALILASSGLYGLLSYSVAQRRQEFSVRVALGARATDVVRMVVRQGMGLVAIGIVIGLAGGFAMASMVASLLFGVSPGDPLTYASVTTTLVLVAAVACYVPARRAVLADPIRALR